MCDVRRRFIGKCQKLASGGLLSHKIRQLQFQGKSLGTADSIVCLMDFLLLMADVAGDRDRVMGVYGGASPPLLVPWY